MNCTDCQDYNKGKGSIECKTCPQFRSVLPKARPGPHIVNMRSEILEELAEVIPKDLKDILRTLDPTDATMLLQAQVLNMTHQEIAEYHLYNARKTVQRKLNIALELIKSMST